MHALFDSPLRPPGDGEELDAKAQFLGIVDVEGRHVANAFGDNRAEIDLGAEGEAREQGQLVGRVDPIDVETRVGLGVAQGLGFGEHILEGALALAHVAQDVIAGAVEDADDAVDPVGRQPLADRLDDRDAAGDRRLVGQRGPGLGRGPGQRRAVLGQERLVRVPRHDDRVVEPAHPLDIEAPVPVPRSGGHGRYDDRPAAAVGDEIGLGREQLDDAATDRSQAGNGDFQGRCHSPAARFRLAMASTLPAVSDDCRNCRMLRTAWRMR